MNLIELLILVGVAGLCGALGQAHRGLFARRLPRLDRPWIRGSGPGNVDRAADGPAGAHFLSRRRRLAAGRVVDHRLRALRGDHWSLFEERKDEEVAFAKSDPTNPRQPTLPCRRMRRSHVNSTPLTARALLFLVALTLVYSALGIIAILREGSWEQVPSWDCAHFHTLAIQAKRAVAADGLSGLATFWAHGTGVHAPLVPVTSGLFQLILGEHRWAAELVLVLGTFGLVTGTYVATTCLYGEATAYAVSALTLALPTVLGLSRTYFFEHPFTGLFALSMAALLSSDGLSKWRPIVLFGVLAGFASVTRTGAAVLFVGPAAVMSIGALRQSQPMTRLLRLVAGALLAIAIAATWYGPNLSAILQYIRSNTYGAHAGFFAGGSAFRFRTSSCTSRRMSSKGSACHSPRSRSSRTSSRGSAHAADPW